MIIEGRKKLEKQNLKYVIVDEFQDIYGPKDIKMFIAVAYKDMRNRKKVFERINKLGYNLINIKKADKKK